MAQSASPTPAFVKGAPAMLAVEFMAIEDRTAGTPMEHRYGIFSQQDALRA